MEDNLGRLFALRMRISRRAKVETNLSGLFSERKIPHYVDPEVNLRGLFGIKQPRPLEMPEVASVKSWKEMHWWLYFVFLHLYTIGSL